MTTKLVLAKLETEEIVIGEDDGGEYLKKCLNIVLDVDPDDCCKYSISMYPIFDYLSDDMISIDEDLVIYKTENIDEEVVEQYRSIAKKLANKKKIENNLVNINKNIKDRKK